jgi:hypothetical protein
LRAEVDEVVCAITPEPFDAVGRWYEDFSQTTDEEVRELLALQGQPESRQEESRAPDDPLVLAVRKRVQPLAGTARDYDPLIELLADARFAPARRSVPRHPRVLPGARRDHQAADRGEGFQRGCGRS